MFIIGAGLNPRLLLCLIIGAALVRDGTITVQLTPNGSFQHLYVVSTSLSEIKIGAADGETIDCYYVIYGERADLDPLVVEKIV